jgi:hypothetical protein
MGMIDCQSCNEKDRGIPYLLCIKIAKSYI